MIRPLIIILCFLITACDVKERPILSKDDIKPGPGLFTGTKGEFEIPLDLSDDASESH